MDEKHQIPALKAVIARQKIAIINKDCLIRNYKTRIKNIRNSLDYLLEHPYSTDKGVAGRKHKRDTPKKQKSKK